ncbi:NUDIX hydrolase [Actinopolymorpha alba]|uniref:NUDIX hydrolase n=1 Tax=Actinopolymorpha alba TaxID=533267 RepID=UPI000381B0B4|nr:NUDIX domain-containing protein [Actinopolymorpha alba]
MTVVNQKHPQRVGAYAVCVDDGRILLARFAEPAGRWTLPGGGVEHAEYPADGVVREVLEETGYQVRVRSLLGVHTDVWSRSSAPWRRSLAEVHAVHILYEVAVTGGELRHELDGSTDQAAWFDLDQVPALRQGVLLKVGLDLYHRRPVDGRSGT